MVGGMGMWGKSLENIFVCVLKPKSLSVLYFYYTHHQPQTRIGGYLLPILLPSSLLGPGPLQFPESSLTLVHSLEPNSTHLHCLS